MLRSTLLLAGALVLSGCDAIQPDRAALLSTTNAPVERPRCDACHAYAPRTGAHRFHLASADRSPESCQSCHAATIRMSGPVFDSAFVDTAGNAYNTHQWPWMPFSREGKTFDSLSSSVLDSAPMMAGPRREGEEFPEWMVRPSDRPDIPGHANGRVDVVIPENHHMRGAVAKWNPQTWTCSNVKCHDDQGAAYLWKEK